VGGHPLTERLHALVLAVGAVKHSSGAKPTGSPSGAMVDGFTPTGRRIRFEKVWLVISVVTWRVEMRSRIAWVSGSENGAGPR
jgi:hypothetical protein